jgi:hypothetical protein
VLTDRLRADGFPVTNASLYRRSVLHSGNSRWRLGKGGKTVIVSGRHRVDSTAWSGKSLVPDELPTLLWHGSPGSKESIGRGLRYPNEGFAMLHVNALDQGGCRVRHASSKAA